jgi:hypothetical protein
MHHRVYLISRPWAWELGVLEVNPLDPRDGRGYPAVAPGTYLRNLTATFDDFGEDRVDVLICPAPDLAARTLGLYSIWGETLKVEDQPVKALRRDP